jgi:hypothetical protein
MVEAELLIDRRGAIFEVRGVRVYDPLSPQPGNLTINFSNGSGEWADLVFESYYPTGSTIWTSGRLDNGTSASHVEELRYHLGKGIHITRWRPGLFGIPGNGGGEAFLELPDSGSVTIDITATG